MAKKIGPNEKCFCGSGKKFKKCHGSQTQMPPRSRGASEAVAFEKARAFLKDTAGLKPGCYDDPRFTSLERENPRVLEVYAKHVSERPHTSADDSQVRRVVEAIEQAIRDHVSGDELRGNCANISGAVLRMLEAEGVWAAIVKGNFSATFAPELGLRPRYFWSHDVAGPGGFTGHAWVVATPYAVIDFTTKAQRWEHGEDVHLPTAIIREAGGVRVIEPRADLAHADPSHRASVLANPEHLELWNFLRPCEIDLGKVVVRYQAGGVTAPDSPMSAMPYARLAGLSVPEFYEKEGQAACRRGGRA